MTLNIVEVPLTAAEQMRAAELLKADYPQLSTSERLALLARAARAMRQSWSHNKSTQTNGTWPKFEHLNQMRFNVIVKGADEPRDLEIELFGDSWYAKLQADEYTYEFLMEDGSWGFEGAQQHFSTWREAFEAATATTEIEWLL